ncbi:MULTISPECIES: glycosyltransferase family 4 protein [Stenotrophomonas]|uniref:Glycosyl transferase group 1 n=1 Tax=Stenotrophomonas maltophilia (strain R551-3) TaxID=391008 RepID=B4SKH2_STRM5|nr:glycosyltransferase family 4 protein [Stenotrophomonas maltophilia]ACF53279.1 glycosyl transferase group 1 [Stenotrophomonas maltophilia R551-3]MBH1493762.1 glycosyltransferase family 4 protein [Stenotrophomonas maltophilia]MBN4961238.1 glycosyltransferase family 4 protein [Stenotrophomonas maltophilia]MBN5141497.1 glycosyltransferase family 4 protein [Stenotrophomonas maltophilia]OCK47062.1 glycosyl transferase [Stenotrophomonas maltophilia]
MKILYTNFHYGDGGGHTTYIVSLARALHGQHTLHVAAPADSRLLRTVAEEGIATAVPMAFGSGLPTLPQQLAEQRALRRRVRDEGIDLVHVNGARDHRFVMQGLLGMRRPPIVLTKHNSKPTNTLGNAFRARWATDRVIAVSADTKRLLEQGPYRRCPIDVVRNGVDLERYSPLPAGSGHALRQQWTRDPLALVLVSNAGTDDYKGWIDLAQAIVLLPDAVRPHVHMAVAGHLPSAQQREQVQALGEVAAQVHFTGLLGDTRALIAAGDAGFVLSNDIETISFACREMMASGKPMLVSDYAGLPENIEQGVDGWVVPTRDVAAIAAQVQAMYEQRHALPTMGMAARRHAQAEFGLQTFAEATLASYEAVLAAS